ncbi:MAG: ChbG/HpnK family deacetylase [Rhizobiales bacterium]|nr:ChbG/HpnK family deacetylase [Hyphomicrobiales bacterium]
MARFVLTADDYAMTPAVTRGILACLEAGRITATGAMTNRPHWKSFAPQLGAFEGKADLGLHFNLTCGVPLTAMPRLAPGGELPKLPDILRAGSLRRLPLAEVAGELEAQLSAFEDAMGRMPDFIDGHQHVHAMPGVRRALGAVLAKRYPREKPYLRNPVDRLAAIRARRLSIGKATLVATLSGPFAKRMRALGFSLNEGFAGYSSFNTKRDFGSDFAHFLKHPGAKHLVMCHPGEVDDELLRLDPVTATRPLEKEFFLSERFLETCDAAGMKMVRFAQL